MKDKKTKTQREIELEQCIRLLVGQLRTQARLAKDLGGEIAVHEANGIAGKRLKI